MQKTHGPLCVSGRCRVDVGKFASNIEQVTDELWWPRRAGNATRLESSL